MIYGASWSVGQGRTSAIEVLLVWRLLIKWLMFLAHWRVGSVTCCCNSICRLLLEVWKTIPWYLQCPQYVSNSTFRCSTRVYLKTAKWAIEFHKGCRASKFSRWQHNFDLLKKCWWLNYWTPKIIWNYYRLVLLERNGRKSQ